MLNYDRVQVCLFIIISAFSCKHTTETTNTVSSTTSIEYTKPVSALKKELTVRGFRFSIM